MTGMKSLWRPELFSTVGAGFENDQTLQNGVHLRWRNDYRLGLPFERGSDVRGAYHIYIGQHGSVQDAKLFSDTPPFAAITHRYPMGGFDSGMSQSDGTLRFWRRNRSPYRHVATYWGNAWPQLARMLWSHSPEERAMAGQAHAIFSRLCPVIEPGTINREYADVCAVDLLIQDGSGAATCVAIDRKGRRVAEQEVDSGNPMAILRAPGIAGVRLEEIPGQPLATVDEVRWIFCEEYCQSTALWSEATMRTVRFNGDPDYHKPDVVEQEHYRPFLAGMNVDAPAVSDAIMQELVGTQEVQTLLDHQLTWEMANHRMMIDEAPDETINVGTKVSMPILQSLIAAGVDPVMARILGLYGYLDENDTDLVRGQDIKVEAVLPFFLPDNLWELNNLLLSMMPGNPPPSFFLETQQVEQSILHETALCGLLLSPSIEEQPPVPPPDDFTTTVTVTDVPTQKNETSNVVDAELFCESTVTVPKTGVVDTVPYLKPVAYLMERSLNSEPFVNTAIEDSASDIFDELGIVPPVYFLQSREDQANALTLHDDFATHTKPGQTVRYRLTAYDLFGRPSDPIESPTASRINVPNHRPKEPSNLSAQIDEDNGLLYLECYFSIDDETAPLEAQRQFAEITVHRLPLDPTDPQPPETVKWSGSIPARRFAIPFLADNSLNLSQVSQSCVNLSWAKTQLSRFGANEAICSAEFPTVPPLWEAVDPPSMPHAETGFRTYRLRMAIADAATLEATSHRWCVRTRIRGKGQGGGIFSMVYSNEPCVAGEWLITPAPPVPVQPPLLSIPVSTYPDRFGNAYYGVDLSEFVAVGDLVNIYSVRLDRMADAMDALVDGRHYAYGGAENDLVIAAHGAKERFELLTPQPIEYTAENRFYPVHVPGDLRHYHVVAVVGTNEYLEEHPWSQAGILLFTTPEPLQLPTLQLLKVEPSVETGAIARSLITLQYSVLAAPIPDPAHPPKVQLLRRNLTAQSRATSSAGTVTGTATTDANGESIYHFALTNRVSDWNRYAYEAYLLVYLPGRNEYVRAGEPIRATATALWAGHADPLPPTTPLQKAAVNSHLEITTTFPAGDFDVSLSKILPDRSVHRLRGSLRGGTLRGLPTDAATLTVNRVFDHYEYQLTVHDQDTSAGDYTLRLAFADMVWAKKE